jgi:hypothetical protein
LCEVQTKLFVEACFTPESLEQMLAASGKAEAHWPEVKAIEPQDEMYGIHWLNG